MKGTSNIPLVMGIIGGILSLPSAICSAACAVGLVAFSFPGVGVDGLGEAIMLIGIIGGLLGIVGGIMGKPLPIPAGIVMLISVVLVGIKTIMGFNFLGVICVALLLTGAAVCFAQKKE